MILRTSILTLLVGAIALCASIAHADPTSTPYVITFSITGTVPGTGWQSLRLALPEHGRATMTSNPTDPVVDAGVKLGVALELNGTVAMLDGDIEVTSPLQGPHRVRAHRIATIPLDTPTAFATLVDATNRRYDVAVSITRR